MSLEPAHTPGTPPPQEGPKRDFMVFAILGGVLACLALVTLVSMARSIFTAGTAPAITPVQSSAARRSLIDFTLTNTAGQTVRRSDVHGHWLIVNFVFSSCSLSCMQVNFRMAEIQKLVADQPDVRLLSLTIDPRSDSPAVLAKFSEQFHADTNRWLFLTGDKRILYPLIAESFLGPEDPTPANLIPGGWSKIHHIALVDPQGQVRGLFEGMRPKITGEVMAALARMRKGELTP